MPPGEGSSSSTPGNVVDGDALPRKPRCRISRRPIETMNPGNLQFKRQIEELEAKQQEEEQRRHKQMSAFLGSVCCKAGVPYWNILSGGADNGESPVPWNEVFEFPGPSSDKPDGTQQGEGLLKDSAKFPGPSDKPDGTQQGEEGLLKDSAKPPDDSDFLEGTFIKINSDKQKGSRNKKNSKKKGKGGKGRKQSHASEIKSDPSPTKPSSTCADAGSGEALASSSSHVAVGVPVLEYNTSSRSLVTELLITPAVNSKSNSVNEKGSSSSSNDGFKSSDSTASYSADASSSVNNYYTGGKAWNNKNNTVGDYAGSLSSDATSERSLFSASECITSRGFVNKMSGEEIKPNHHRQSLSLAISPSGSQQEGSPCTDYASNGGDFQKVISRKAAQKMKKMQRLGSPAMAASGPTIAHAVVPSAPRHEVMTIGHYIKQDCSNGRKPNHKIHGKNQKGPSLSNVSKTGYTDGENVPGSSRMLRITVQTRKPGSSQMALSSTSRHHVTLEETSSPGYLPMKGELKAPVGGDTERTDSTTAPASEKTSSLGNLANSTYVDRKEQKKDMAPVAVGGDTKGTDSTATSSDKTSSQLGHLANSSCVDRKKQKKNMAPVGGDTKDTDYTAPSSSDNHLANSSCVDREEQKKARAPVGGDSDTKNTDSIAPSSDKTSSSLGHLSNSSCVKREEQKKQENEQAFSAHASSELDKIIKAANDAFIIQAASDAYMIYGGHADIETFLHSATPVIAQISCTANNSSLQDQCLWRVWRWYEEPEYCGIEVEMQGSINPRWENSSTYFVPSLSAVQLFGQSGNKFRTPEEPCLLSQNHGGLLFEYFESEMPFVRPPLFTKIKQLLNGVNVSGNPIFGDPKQLRSVKLSDLHPASWYCVAWYPICQIPSATRSRQAAFLTYHTLGKLVPQTYPTYMTDGLQHIVCPVVGLLGYTDQEEKWYHVGEPSRSKPPNGSRKTHTAELLNKKMRALRHCASIMSKAAVPRASGEAMNYHPDYEFFWPRSHY